MLLQQQQHLQQMHMQRAPLALRQQEHQDEMQWLLKAAKEREAKQAPRAPPPLPTLPLPPSTMSPPPPHPTPLALLNPNIPYSPTKKAAARTAATAVFNPVTREWEETDEHRLAQRHKQVCFGKVTAGYRNYIATVPIEERQRGNEHHPVTPRATQVCSKRAWDCQVGRWRRALHAWDNSPPAEQMRLSATALQQRQHEMRVQPAPPPPPPGAVLVNNTTVKVKCMLAAAATAHCKIVVTPRHVTYKAFVGLVEHKFGPVTSLYYHDTEDDMVDIDDDGSLRTFLDSPGSPKLVVKTPEEDMAQAITTVREKLPKALADQIIHALSCEVPWGTPKRSPAMPALVDRTPSPYKPLPCALEWDSDLLA